MYQVVKKISQALLTIFLVSIIIFVMFQLIPGDPILSKLGEISDPALEKTLRIQYGLDKTPIERYFNWILGVFSGDLGLSIRYTKPVKDLILERLPNTIGLSLIAMSIIIFLGLPLGVVTAKYSKNAKGFFFNMLTQLFTSIPSFFLAIILILLFCLNLKWFDVVGYVPLYQDLFGFIKGLTLPAIAIAIGSMTTVARYTRSSILEQMNMDYVRTAKNKGLSENKVLYLHVLPNSLIMIITIFGLMIANILGGAIVVESAFSIPGIGSLLHIAIKSRDLPLVQGISLYITVVVVLVFLILDVLYIIIDPRIEVFGGKTK